MTRLGLVTAAVRGRLARGWASLRSRPRSAASVCVVSIASLGLLVAMFLSDGFRATSYDLQDSAVWATRAEGRMVGRVNTQIGRQDALLRPSDVPAPDVAQDGRHVFVVDRAGKQLIRIAPDTLELSSPGVPLPPEATVEVAANTLMVEAGGKVWVGDADSAPSLGTTDRDPDLDLGEGAVATLGRDGRLVAFSPAAGELTVVDGDERSTSRLEGLGEGAPIQLTVAGDRPVVLDTGSNQLVLPGEDPVDLSDLGGELQLQLPGDDPGRVLVAADSGLWSVSLGDGSIRPVREHPNSAPVRPARIAGCSYGAWAGEPTMIVACDGHDPVEGRVSGSELRFRINRRNVILNELTDGGVWVHVDGQVLEAHDWEEIEGPEDEDDENDPDGPKVPDITEDNQPPQAEPDEVGARPGRPAILTVLDNDVDPNGDVLIITEVEAVTPADASVQIVAQGQAIQFTAPAQATGRYTFTYTITDGRLGSDGKVGSDSATVTVRLTPAGRNAPPELKADRHPMLRVESGRSATYDVLQDWWDPDGDPIFLEGAAVEEFPDDVQTLPTGTLTFNDRGTATGRKTVAVSVRDVPGVPGTEAHVGNGVLTVQVEPRRTTIPPTARPDHRSTVVGASIVIEPLANDDDGNAEELHIARLDTSSLEGRPVSVALSTADETVSFRADEEGTYVFTYDVTDGAATATGLIRVDVASADRNRPPTAGRDLIVLPVQANARRTIDLLANDLDPDGDVMVVTSIKVPAEAASVLSAQLLEHRRLRVAASSQLSTPVVITYQLSDGQAQTTGEVVIVSTPVSSQNRSPLVAGDVVTVRTSDVVSIPVLANDVDPEGDDLLLARELVVAPGDGEGLAFVSGSVVRFVAPSRPMTVRFTYAVSDGLNQGTGEVVVRVRGGEENAAPRPRTVEARVIAGASVRIPIPLAGIDPDGDSVTLSGIGVDAPQLGRVVTPVGHDSITYEAFKASTGGTDTFTYRVVDRRGATAEGMIRVGVVPRPDVNGPPQPMDDRVEVAPGTTVRVPVLANDYDPDGDELSLDARGLQVPEALRAEIDGTKVKVTAPDEVRPVPPLVYTVTDGRGGSASAKVDVIVSEDAVGLPPIARDDEARPPADRDAARVEVDVLANDDDPDGLVEELTVTPVGVADGVTVDGEQRLVVELRDEPRLVAYQVEDPQGLTAIAIVRIPARGSTLDRPPVQRDDAPKLVAVQGGEPLEIQLADHVVDPEGQPVRLTVSDRVSATHHDGSQLVRSATELVFRPAPGYHGPASITFEVTDGQTADAGNRVVMSLPVTIKPAGNSPPSFDGGLSVTVAPKEAAQELDLAKFVTDPDPDDTIDFELTNADQLPTGVRAGLEGSVLSVVAEAEAVPSTTAELRITADDRTNDPVTGTVTVTVVESTRPRPACTAAVIDEADAGTAVRRDVLGDCFNPFPDEPLQLVSAVAHGDHGAPPRIDGGVVEFTPKRGFHGTATVRYTVMDAIGRTAESILSIVVRDVPGRPTPPTRVEVSSRTVVLSWSAPDTNGAPIDRYEVAWNGGSQECPQTTCRITGLTNDTRYRFTVRAHNAAGFGEPSDPSEELRPDQRPEPPANVHLEFVSDEPDGRLTATWDAATTEGSPVTAYEVQVMPPVPGQPPAIQVGAVTELKLTGLENGTSYQVRVRAINAAETGPSDWSLESEAAVPARAPDPPTGVSAARRDDPTGGIIEVSWTAPASDGGDAVRQYLVTARREGSTTPERSTPVGGQELSVVIGGLDTSARYRFTVVAENKAGSSEPSEPSPSVHAPARPGDIGAVSASDNVGGIGLDRKATLSFTPPDDGGSPIEYYEVQGGGTSVEPTGPSLLVVHGLTNGVAVQLRVRACNLYFCSANWAVANTVTPYGPVGTPSVTTSKPNKDQVTFNWSPPAPNGRAVTGVQISVNGGGWQNASPSGSVTVGNGRNQTHSIRVRAVDAAGQVGPDRTASATTDPPDPPPPTPTITAALGGTVGSGESESCPASWRWLTATFHNFPPGTIQVGAYQTKGDVGDFGLQWPVAIGANGSGSLGDGYFCVGPGSTSYVYVPGTSYRSNYVSN